MDIDINKPWTAALLLLSRRPWTKTAQGDHDRVAPHGQEPSFPSISLQNNHRKARKLIRIILLALGITLLWSPCPEARDVSLSPVVGWRISSAIRSYVTLTLNQYMNGAADLYRTCDFEELRLAEYANKEMFSVTVEVYPHKRTRDASGIFSRVRLPVCITAGGSRLF